MSCCIFKSCCVLDSPYVSALPQINIIYRHLFFGFYIHFHVISVFQLILLSALNNLICFELCPPPSFSIIPEIPVICTDSHKTVWSLICTESLISGNRQRGLGLSLKMHLKQHFINTTDHIKSWSVINNGKLSSGLIQQNLSWSTKTIQTYALLRLFGLWGVFTSAVSILLSSQTLQTEPKCRIQ